MADPLETLNAAVAKAGSAAALARSLGYDDAKTARLRRALRGETGKVGADLVSDATAYLTTGNVRESSGRNHVGADSYIERHDQLPITARPRGDVCLFVIRAPNGRPLWSYWITGHERQDGPPVELSSEVPERFS